MRIIEILIKSVLLFVVVYVFSSCSMLSKGMSSSEYYDYLRKDTVTCELNTFTLDTRFEAVLDTVIKSWQNCRICNEDLHPFIFEIEEELLEDTLVYTIRINASPKMAHQYYLGGFAYKDYVFAVLKKSTSKTLFLDNEQSKPTSIYFCDRIHSTKCGLLIKCNKINNNYRVTSVECQEAEIIKIK